MAKFVDGMSVRKVDGMSVKEAEKIIKDALTTKPRPFLPRKGKMKTVQDLFNRYKDLEHCIANEEYLHSYYKEIIKHLESDECLSVMTTQSHECVDNMYYTDRSKELKESLGNCLDDLRKNLISIYNARLKYAKELIHTCQDEMDWMNAKLAICGKEKTEAWGNFEFDPEKDHV